MYPGGSGLGQGVLLPPGANLILELCDGSLTATQIADLLAETFDLTAPPGREVEEALAKLEAEGLTQ